MGGLIRISGATAITGLVSLLSPVGCGPDTRTMQGNVSTGVVTDSAQVRLVNHPDLFNAGVEEWMVDTVPELELGDDGGKALYRVRGALIVQNEILVIGDGSARRLRMFGLDGTPMMTVGGEGEGPGEFRSISSVHPMHGDSIAVYDGSNRRITVFSSTGEFGRSRAVEPVPDLGGQLKAVTVLGDGSPILQTEPFVEGAVGTVRFDTWVHSLGDGDYQQIGVFPGEEYYVAPRQSTRVEYGPAPFGRQLKFATGAQVVYVMDTSAPVVWAFGADARLRMMIRDHAENKRVTQDVLDTYLGTWAEGREAEEAEQIRESVAQRIEHDTLPGAGEILVSASGDLWIGAYRVDGTDAQRTYAVVGQDGSVRGRVSLPSSHELLWAGADRVVVLTTDELDVESVQVLRVAAASG